MVQEPRRKIIFSVERDAWLSGALGREAFRLSLPDPDAAEAALGRGAGPFPLSRAGFYTAKVPTERVALARGLCAGGFAVADVSVVLERAPGTLEAPPGVRVRTARPEDEAAVADIAGSCFVYSRFHLDPAFPKALAHAVKRSWTVNCLRGRRGDGVWVAESGGQPAGFLAHLTSQEGGGSVKVIDLIGVSTAFTRRGVGRALVARFLSEAGAAGLARVGTQAANVPSIRLYESCGFRTASSHFVLHAHAEGRP